MLLQRICRQLDSRLWNRKNCSCGCHRAMDVSKKLRTEPAAKCGVGQLVISAVPAHPVQMARPGPSPITVPSFGAGRGGGTDGTRQTNNSPPCFSRHTRLYLRVVHSNRFFTHLINR